MSTDRIPVVLSWSGGKDSSLALQALCADSAFEPVALLTTITQDYDRISMHGVRRELLVAQSESIGLPLIEAAIPAKASNEIYGAAMSRALDAIRAQFHAVRHIGFGDLYLRDVRDYRERQLTGTGFTPLFPLWDKDTHQLADRFIDDGFEAILTCVDTHQIPASFSGRLFDRAMLADLPPTADPCGENGEFHTFVAAGPGFTTRIPYTRGDVVLRDGRFAYCDLHPVRR